ncbi:hypothetical protein AAG747_17250 [Rapidithrix thailandica]|uniref:Lipoprotein n=1 Tax=Rapidithrix thailandica TaxID=413964 RepID=A0AAW9SB25_9BACT
MLKPRTLYQCLTAGLLLGFFACNNNNESKAPEEPDIEYAFETALTKEGTLANEEINEASGLVASRSNVGMFWTHNDSGDTSRIFLFDKEGKNLATYYLNELPARDWEDIALGKGPEEGVHYLYIAEMGDNNAQYDTKHIYRLKEPVWDAEGEHLVNEVEDIQFVYPDGKRDAEALMADPLTGDLWIVSKREEKNRIYRLPSPHSLDTVIVAEYYGEIPVHNSNGGDISANGTEILLKNYDKIFYWPRAENQTVAEALLSQVPQELYYEVEPQGEAIAWDPSGNGFYTLSEERSNVEAVLYYYERLDK